MTKASFNMWCAQDPEGNLIPDTVSFSEDEVHFSLFNFMDKEFTTKYWKKLDESKAALKKLGYKIVKVTVKKAAR